MADTMGDTKNYQVNRSTDEGSPGPDDVVIVYATYPNIGEAKTAGRALVEARLAACVNILPGMTAIYEWEGGMHEDPEVVVLVKTQRRLVARVFAGIRAAHSYDNPALVEIDVAGGSPAYLGWVLAQTRAGAV